MPACPRGQEFASLSPSGSTENETAATKQSELMNLLSQLTEKCRSDPQFAEQEAKQTELLLSITRYVLFSNTRSMEERRSCLQRIQTISEDLLNEMEEINASGSLTESSAEPLDTPSSISIPIAVMTKEDDGDFSLDDLANEYLQNDSPSMDKVTPSSESEDISSTMIEQVDSKIEPCLVKSPLDSILFSDSLSSQVAADGAEGIWKEKSSLFGEIFCTKLTEVQSEVRTRVTDCLLDRSLYERLSRLIHLLPKQCPVNSAPNLAVRPAKPSSRPGTTREFRPNPNRPNFRPDFPPQNDQQRMRPPHPRTAGPQNFVYPNYQGGYAAEPHPHYPHPNRHGSHRGNYRAAGDPHYGYREPMRNYSQGYEPRPKQSNKKMNNPDNQGPPRHGPRNHPSGPKYPPQDRNNSHRGPTSN